MDAYEQFKSIWTQYIDINKKEVKELGFKELYKISFGIDSMNKYEGGFSLPGAKDLKQLMEDQDFQTKWERLGFRLSMNGSGYGLAYLKYNGKIYIENVRTFDVKTKFGRLIDIRIQTDDLSIINPSVKKKEQREILTRFYFDKNEVTVLREDGYYEDGSWITTSEAIEYKTNEIPIYDAYNNSLGFPDLYGEADNQIDQMNHLYNSLPNEWEKGKLQVIFNELLNSTEGAKTYRKKIIEDGESLYSTSDSDGMIANAMAPFTPGVFTIEQAQKTIGFYDSKIREMCFLFRDHGSDSRKNEMDLLLYNQKAYEHFEKKLSFRQRQLQRMINLLADVSGFEGGRVKINSAPFEEFRMANLKAIADLKVAQAEQARAIADKNTMEAESMRVNIKNGKTVDVTQTQSQEAIQKAATSETTTAKEGEQ